jgi:hypothetical protein
MNEKIKQLAEKAGFYLWENEPWKPEGAVVDWSCNYDSELEKFAELIIRECGVSLNPMLRDMISRGQAYDLIKQNFDIET